MARARSSNINTTGNCAAERLGHYKTAHSGIIRTVFHRAVIHWLIPRSGAPCYVWQWSRRHIPPSPPHCPLIPCFCYFYFVSATTAVCCLATLQKLFVCVCVCVCATSQALPPHKPHLCIHHAFSEAPPPCQTPIPAKTHKMSFTPDVVILISRLNSHNHCMITMSWIA